MSAARESRLDPPVGSPALCAETVPLLLTPWILAIYTGQGIADDSRGLECPLSKLSLSKSASVLNLPPFFCFCFFFSVSVFDPESSFPLSQVHLQSQRCDHVHHHGDSLFTQQGDFTNVSMAPEHMVISNCHLSVCTT